MLFVPGHPGYQQYITTLAALELVLCTGVSVLSLIELRRNPRDPGRRAITAALIFITASAMLGNPAVNHALVGRFGEPNIFQLITSYCNGVGYTTSLVIALSAWQDTPEKRRKTTRRWLVMAVCMLIAMLALWHASLLSATSIRFFAHIDDGTHRLERATSLPDIVLVWATLKMRSLCGHHSRAPGQGWLPRSLSLIRLGTSMQLFFFAGCAVVIVAHGVFGFTVPHPETFGIPYMALTASVILFGIALPIVGPSLEAGRERREAGRAYRELEPLWADLAHDHPLSALPHTTHTNIDYLLYRRVVEIRDGLTRLAPHITPPHPDDNPEPAAQAAAQIHRALTNKHTADETDLTDGFTPLAGDNPHADLHTETTWLRHTATHYAQTR